MMTNKSGRYHRTVFFPKDFGSLFKEYHEAIYGGGPLTFSLHSVTKLLGYTGEFGRYLFSEVSKIITSGALVEENVFEFYTDKEGKLEKACIRYSIKDLPVDIVLVISRSSVIITCYTISKENTKENIDRRVYVKKERK